MRGRKCILAGILRDYYHLADTIIIGRDCSAGHCCNRDIVIHDLLIIKMKRPIWRRSETWYSENGRVCIASAFYWPLLKTKASVWTSAEHSRGVLEQGREIFS